MEYDHTATEKLKTLCRERHIDTSKLKKQQIIIKLLEFDANFENTLYDKKEKEPSKVAKKQSRKSKSKEREIAEDSNDLNEILPQEQKNTETEGIAFGKPPLPNANPFFEKTDKSKANKLEALNVDTVVKEEEEEEVWRSPSKVKGGKLPSEVAPNKKDKKRKDKNSPIRLGQYEPDLDLEQLESRMEQTIQDKENSSESQESDDESFYQDWSSNRLKQECKEKGIQITSKMKRHELIGILKNFDHDIDINNSPPPPPQQEREVKKKESTSNFIGLSVPQLKLECKKRGVVGYRKLGRHEIVELLEQYEEAQKENSIKKDTLSEDLISGDSTQELIKKCKKAGFHPPKRFQVRDLEARLAIGRHFENQVLNDLKTSEEWVALMEDAKTYPVDDGHVAYLTASKKKNEILIIETSKVKQRIDFLQSCYGPLTILQDHHVSRSKLVKKMLCIILPEIMKIMNTDKSKCKRKECEDPSHFNWFYFEDADDQDILLQALNLAIVMSSWHKQ